MALAAVKQRFGYTALQIESFVSPLPLIPKIVRGITEKLFVGRETWYSLGHRVQEMFPKNGAIEVSTLEDFVYEAAHAEEKWVYKKLLPGLLAPLNANELTLLLDNLSKIEGRQPSLRLLEQVTNALTLAKIQEVAGHRFQDDVLQKEAERAVRSPYYLLPPPLSLKNDPEGAEVVFHRFFPNLIESIVRGLVFFNGSNPPSLLWDSYLLLEIYVKILHLPLLVIYGLGALLGSPLIGLGAGLGVTVVALGLIYLYLKKRKPRDRLACGTYSLSNRPLRPIVGRDLEIDQIMRRTLREKTNSRDVLVVGKTGTGKSTLLRGAAHKIKSLAPKVPVYDASSALRQLSADVRASVVTNFQEINRQLGVDADRSVLVIDELLSALFSEGVIIESSVTNLIDFLDKDSHAVIWGSSLSEDYEELKKTDKGRALLSRFEIIDFSKLSKNPEAFRPMVWDYLRQGRGYLQIKDEEKMVAQALNGTLVHEQESLSQSNNKSDKKEENEAQLPGRAVKAIDRWMACEMYRYENFHVESKSLEEVIGQYQLLEQKLQVHPGRYGRTSDYVALENEWDTLSSQKRNLEERLAEEQDAIKHKREALIRWNDTGKEMERAARTFLDSQKTDAHKRFLALHALIMPRRYDSIDK